jgi:hypothetical protein
MRAIVTHCGTNILNHERRAFWWQSVAAFAIEQMIYCWSVRTYSAIKRSRWTVVA